MKNANNLELGMENRPRVETEKLPTGGKRRVDWNRLSPLIFVVKGIALASAENFTANDLAVAVVIAEMMGPEKGEQVCFASLKTISRRSKLSRRTVNKSLANLCDRRAPLFARRLGGKTRGHRHRCFGFRLIRDPIAFTEARDRARAKQLERNLSRLLKEKGLPSDNPVTKDFRFKKLELQAAMLRKELTDAQYKASLLRLDRVMGMSRSKSTVENRGKNANGEF